MGKPQISSIYKRLTVGSLEIHRHWKNRTQNSSKSDRKVVEFWILFIFFFFFFFFGLCCLACGILVPRPGIEPGPSAVRAQSPNDWTTREFPHYILKTSKKAKSCYHKGKMYYWTFLYLSCDLVFLFFYFLKFF